MGRSAMKEDPYELFNDYKQDIHCETLVMLSCDSFRFDSLDMTRSVEYEDITPPPGVRLGRDKNRSGTTF